MESPPPWLERKGSSHSENIALMLDAIELTQEYMTVEASGIAESLVGHSDPVSGLFTPNKIDQAGVLLAR
jgi:hypothetical protein